MSNKGGSLRAAVRRRNHQRLPAYRLLLIAFPMKFESLHTWKLTPREAIALQNQLADRVQPQPPLGDCNLIAGADVSYARFSNVFYAGVVVLRTSDWTIVEKQGAVFENAFPYVPGLLSFREAPAVLEVFAKLNCEPDAIIVDGQGFSHPRRLGFASHVGIWLDRPTIGCAKSRLIGEYREPGLQKGSSTRLLDVGEVIGRVVRTKTAVKPLIVSVGHKIDLESAVRITLDSCRGYRIPEPTRQAHILVNALRCEAAC